MKSFRISILFISCIIMVMIANLAYAGDGQIDILPNGSETFTISQPGSYILTGNVTMTADRDCIEIKVDDVTLDLNGCVITGFSGSSHGVKGDSADGISVRNGVIRDFGAGGIVLRDQCSVENLKVTSCDTHGVKAGDNARILSVTVRQNFDDGIKVGSNSIVRHCIAEDNGGQGINLAGITVGTYSTVQGCVCRGNKSGATNENIDIYGIFASNSCVIQDNVCGDNTNSTTNGGGRCIGISAGDESVIRNNTCRSNRAFNQGTDVIGIYAEENCVIVNNTASGNTANGAEGSSIGIICENSCQVRDNICSNNNALGANSRGIGISGFSYNHIIENTCYDNEGKDYSIGIYANGGGLRIQGNHCSRHSTATNSYGVSLRNPTNNTLVIRNTCLSNDTDISMGNGNHYCAENVTEDAIADTTGVTLGTGDRSNVTY